ncbi:MAG TPA: S8 family serine peptidase [Ktedonobacteraceae bacterium]|nr:S8 family serine peptidase [Ktedonobacteraceae bacterium]
MNSSWSKPFTSAHLQYFQAVPPLEDITPEWAWGGSTGKGIKVAVIDSGVDASHPALGSGVNGYLSLQEGPEGLTYDSEPHKDDYGHGTACAGIIRSIAPECEIYSIKVLGSSLVGRGNIFIVGLNWAIENGMHVCNLSLGTVKRDFLAPLHELADLAYFRNIMLIASANNLTLPLFPSVFSSVISVASHDIKDPYLFYYNSKPPVEFGAFGINVRVPWLNGGWTTTTGNSFATPHITGIVTLILSKHKGLTPFQVKTILHALSSNAARPTDSDQPQTQRERRVEEME